MHNATDRLCSLRVADVMAKQVVKISSSQTLAEAAGIFISRDVSSAPVVDADGLCVGVLSAVDFLKGGAAGGGQAASAAGGSKPVGHYMTPAVQSIGSGESLLKAAQVMCNLHIHRLPVMDGERVVGVISTMDIVAAVVNAVDEMRTNELRPADSWNR